MNIDKSFNPTKTHLTISYDETKYIFTGSQGRCAKCDQYEGPVLCHGTDKNYDNWIYLCPNHFSAIAVKKQFCNNCNRNSAIKDVPKICSACMQMIYDNTVEMCNVCNYPSISRSECGCNYCKKY